MRSGNSNRRMLRKPRLNLTETEVYAVLTLHYWNTYKQHAQQPGTHFIGYVREMLQGDALARALLAVGNSALNAAVYMTDILPVDANGFDVHMATGEPYAGAGYSVVFVNSFLYHDPANVVFAFAHELIHLTFRH